nr:MAG TPA: hypothetical protein [Caudoviricetes sp.]DAM25644.1 MAG TPA: hypothetical protein [Caudoviricetes sp.]
MTKNYCDKIIKFVSKTSRQIKYKHKPRKLIFEPRNQLIVEKGNKENEQTII